MKLRVILTTLPLKNLRVMYSLKSNREQLIMIFKYTIIITMASKIGGKHLMALESIKILLINCTHNHHQHKLLNNQENKMMIKVKLKNLWSTR